MRLSIHFALQVGLYFHSATAAYQLSQDYSGDTFFDGWDFYSGEDYTHGFVKYKSQQDALAQGLISVQSSADTQKQAYVGVDFTHKTPYGRPSVRLESKASIDSGLVIADFAHAPGGICGTWPAFWLVGPNWPNGGEIDIVEGVHEQSKNAMTLHTKAGMTFDTSSPSLASTFSGKMTTGNCDVNAPNQPTNAGCSIEDPSTESYGKGFNAVGGGVYATQWTSDSVKIWFFPRNKIPRDIQAGQPKPSETWGQPSASFSGNMKDYFKDQKIILDTTFCGDWAGAVWDHSSCRSKAATCDAYVRDNPSDFEEAYWLVNYIRVYQDDNSSPSTTTIVQPTATTTKQSGRPRTKTETLTLTVSQSSTLVSTTRRGPPPSSPIPTSTSTRRTRTRTRTVTVTPLKASRAARATVSPAPRPEHTKASGRSRATPNIRMRL